MPYSIRFEKGTAKPWKIVKKDTGEVVGSSETKVMAQKSIAARYAGEDSKK